MIKQKLLLSLAIALAFALTASGCGNGGQAGRRVLAGEDRHDGHSEMRETDSDGSVPKGLKEAANPAYKPGSRAIILASHMKGMKGAVATIKGAYDTIAYAVSYTPTTGGTRVTGHKWVIHEEIKDAGAKPFRPGDEVILTTGHMMGMKGANATIESAKRTTVYMVDYTPTTGGEPVINHKWLTEDELAPLK